jgi:hypothetical protein
MQFERWRAKVGTQHTRMCGVEAALHCRPPLVPPPTELAPHLRQLNQSDIPVLVSALKHQNEVMNLVIQTRETMHIGQDCLCPFGGSFLGKKLFQTKLFEAYAGTCP